MSVERGGGYKPQPFQEKFDAGGQGGNTSGRESSKKREAGEKRFLAEVDKPAKKKRRKRENQPTGAGSGPDSSGRGQERQSGQKYYTPDMIPYVTDRIAVLKANKAHVSHIEDQQARWKEKRERLRMYEDIYRTCADEHADTLPESMVAEEKLRTLLQQQREADAASRRPPKNADQWVMSKQERLNLEQQWKQRAAQAPTSDLWLMDNLLIEAVSDMNSLNISQEIMPEKIIDSFYHVDEAYRLLVYERLLPEEQRLVRNGAERRKSSVLQPRESIKLTPQEARILKHVANVVAIPYESKQTHFPFSDVLDRPPPALNQ